MKRYGYMILVFLVLAGLFGCSAEPNEPMGKIKDEGREETKKIEAIGAVGYDGKAIRQKVDNMLDANEKRIRDLEKAAQKASGESD